jgi:hypothetical protein
MDNTKLTDDELLQVFKTGAPVRSAKEHRLVGLGFFEVDLIEMGFTKRELKKLVEEDRLRQCTTTHDNAWRTTYYFPLGGEGEIPCIPIDSASATKH